MHVREYRRFTVRTAETSNTYRQLTVTRCIDFISKTQLYTSSETQPEQCSAMTLNLLATTTHISHYLCLATKGIRNKEMCKIQNMKW
jgi:hypothetical protein